MRTVLVSSEMVDETMPHRFYSPGEMSNPDQQSKRNGRSTFRRSPRREHQKRVGKPARQQDDRKPGSRSRLACERCRQRKIKCSGETEDGQACSNCRNSGQNCKYTRVHSQELLTKPIAWPQPPMSEAVISPTSGMEVYGHPEPGALSNVPVAPCSRLAGYDMTSIDPNSVFSRQSYGVNQVNHGAGTSVYNGQVATQILPSAPQGVLNGYYEWNSSYHISKDPNEAVFPDHRQPDNALTQTAYSYMLPGQGTRCDAPSLAPGPLSFDGQGTTERVLAHPASRAQLQTNFSALPSSSSGLPFAGNTWEVTHRGSMQNMTSGPFTTSPGNPIKQDPSSPQDMVLGYIPMASSATSSPYPGLETVESADDFRTSSGARFTGASYPQDGNGRLLSVSTTESDHSPDSTSASNNNNNNNNYTYSSSERCRTFSGTSDSATLVNDLPYTPVEHSDARSDDGLSFSMLTSDALSDYRTLGKIQRNPRCY